MGYLFDLHGKHFVDMYHLPFNTLYLFLLSSNANDENGDEEQDEKEEERGSW